MESLDLTGRGRRVLIRLQVAGGKRLRMRPMGVQRQQERGAFLHNAHSSMPVPVDASLVPFGLPKPALQLQVVLEEWQRVSTDEESCGKAGHHPRHVWVKRDGEACELLWQVRELGLPRRGRTVHTGQRGRDTLELLQVLTDDLVFRLHLGHASVDTGGQALELGVCTATTVGIHVALERRTHVSQGLRHASAGWWERSALIVIEYATH